MSRIFYTWNTFLQLVKRKNGLIEDLLSKNRVSLNEPLVHTRWGPLMCRNFAQHIQDNISKLSTVGNSEAIAEKLNNILQLYFTATFIPKLKAMNRVPKTFWLRLVETNLKKATAVASINQKDVTHYLQGLDVPISLDPSLVSLWTGKPELGLQVRRLQAAEAKFMNEFKDLSTAELCIFEPPVDNVDFAYKTRKSVISAQKTGHLYIPINLGNLRTVLRGTNSLKLRDKVLNEALTSLQKRQGPAEEALLEVLRLRRSLAGALGFSSYSDLVNSTPSANTAAGKKEALTTQQLLLQRQQHLMQSRSLNKKMNSKGVVPSTSGNQHSPLGSGGVVKALANGARLEYCIQELVAHEVKKYAQQEGSGSLAPQASEAHFFSQQNPVKSLDELSQYLTTDGLVPRLIPALARVLGMEAERMRAGPARGWHPNFDAFQIRVNSQSTGGVAVLGVLYVRPFAEKRHFSRRFSPSISAADDEFTSDLLLTSNSAVVDKDQAIRALTPAANEYENLDRSVVKVIAPGHVLVDLRMPAQKMFAHMDMPPETLHQFAFYIGEALRLMTANPAHSVGSVVTSAHSVFAPLESLSGWMLADSVYSNQVFLQVALKSQGMLNQLKPDDVEAFKPSLAELQLQVSDCLIDTLLHSKAPTSAADLKKITNGVDPLLSVDTMRAAVLKEAQKAFPFTLNEKHSIFSLMTPSALKPEEAGKQSAKLTGRVAAYLELKKPDYVRLHNLSLTAPAPILSKTDMEDLKNSAFRGLNVQEEVELARRRKIAIARGEESPADETIEQFALKPYTLVNEDNIANFVKYFYLGAGKGQKPESQNLLK
eukprot:GDKJ01026380.1.p1 GENE.GDKJ01026380.1~~GDKJ01026380.1.p1  ORF type:complete len:833 (-),score=213.42 GDKJ01026380.1:104-2575(-)